MPLQIPNCDNYMASNHYVSQQIDSENRISNHLALLEKARDSRLRPTEKSRKELVDYFVTDMTNYLENAPEYSRKERYFYTVPTVVQALVRVGEMGKAIQLVKRFENSNIGDVSTKVDQLLRHQRDLHSYMRWHEAFPRVAKHGPTISACVRGQVAAGNKDIINSFERWVN